MSGGTRELPTWMISKLSKPDVLLNRLPVNDLLRLLKNHEINIFVDRGLAVQAASSGVPTSGFTILLSFLFPVLLLSAPVLWYFYTWLHAVTTLVFALATFRAGRALIVANVRDYALANPSLLDLLISRSAIWFERAPESLLTEAQLSALASEDPASNREVDTITDLDANQQAPERLSSTGKRQHVRTSPASHQSLAHLEGNQLATEEKVGLVIGNSAAPDKLLNDRHVPCTVSDAPEGVVSLLLSEESEGADEDDVSRWEAREREIARLPTASVEVARFKDEIDHSPGLSWLIDETIFVVPVSEVQGTYALILLRWNDNWAVWEWEAELVAKGASSIEEAQSHLTRSYVEAQIDDADGTRSAFLDGLSVDLDPHEFFNLPAMHDGYHQVLDSVVSKLKEPMQEIFKEDADSLVEVKCELVSYAAAYKAKVMTQSHLNRMVWNTVVHSIENRIFSCLGSAPTLSGYKERADGSRVFESYASKYATYMKNLDSIIDNQWRNECTDIEAIVGMFLAKKETIPHGVLHKMRKTFDKAVALYSATIIPRWNKDL